MLTLVDNKYLWAISLGGLGLVAPAAGEPVIFSAMGCGPYTPPDKPAAAFYLRQENRERTSEFMVHLGDIFKTSPVKKADAPASPAKKPAPNEPLPPDQLPTEAEYRWTADLLQQQYDSHLDCAGRQRMERSGRSRTGVEMVAEVLFQIRGTLSAGLENRASPDARKILHSCGRVLSSSASTSWADASTIPEWLVRLPQDAAWIKEVLTRPSMSDTRAAVSCARQTIRH
jgi:hypothetical protein